MRRGPILPSSWRSAVKGNVFVLGVVSMLTDVSSEMIYPLLPVFFTGLVSASTAAVYIGLMEGVAESVASLLKFYCGRLSDRLGARKPLAVAGYGISTIARPLMALAFAGWHVVFLRFLDRVGKGIRTSPRDALISESVTEDVRGLAFSFHRMMDHAGAVTGPFLAAVFLYLMLGSASLWERGREIASADEMSALRWLFGLALIPGIAATLTLYLRAREIAPKDEEKSPAKTQDESEQPRKLPRKFYLFVAAVTLFTLGNSSDLFLIFYAQTRFGLGLGYVIVLWTALHLSKIVFSLPGGALSDRLGRRVAIVAGWLIYILVYVAMPFAPNLWAVGALILVYGAYYGMTEGAERALIADQVDVTQRGTAYGVYHGAVGLAALPASLLFGVFWAVVGPTVAFLVGAGLAASATLLLSSTFAAKPGAPEAEKAA